MQPTCQVRAISGRSGRCAVNRGLGTTKGVGVRCEYIAHCRWLFDSGQLRGIAAHRDVGHDANARREMLSFCDPVRPGSLEGSAIRALAYLPASVTNPRPMPQGAHHERK